MELPRAEFDALLARDPDALYALLTGLIARVAELETRLGQHSQNSHRPPASDGPRRPPRRQRTPSGRRPGGQPGHPGHTLALRATPDVVVPHVPARCARCGALLDGAPATQVTRRQVVDLPPLALQVTEHQAAAVACPHCQRETTAPFPPHVAQPVQYGPRLLGLGVYLRQYQLLPYQRIADLLTDLCGAGPRVGTLHRASLAGAAALAPVETAIATALGAAPVAHADETSGRVAGRRQWIHVLSTARLTHYGRHAQRGQAATDAIGILPGFRGWLIHDGWAAYWRATCRHGACNAHHLRELAAVAEQPGQGWATELAELLRAMQQHVDDGRAAGVTASPLAVRDEFVARYRAVLAAGHAANPPPDPAPDAPRRGRRKQSPARNLLERLTTREEAVLAFLHDWTVPFDNNQAERDLRMIKGQQKISGTFRDEASADAFCRIRGYLATLRKQGRPLLAALELTLAGQPPLPALAPE
jgi:transposase